MKKKILFLAFAALALVACGDRNPVDLNNVPEGRAHDLGCDINIVQSATKIVGQSEENGVNYLLDAGWQEIEDEYSQDRLFICKDSSYILVREPYWEEGPRTKLWVNLKDGKVKNVTVMCFCYPSEEPFHHLTEWDAWILRDWKDYDHWEARLMTNQGYTTYDDLGTDDHELFYNTMNETAESAITHLQISYMYDLSVTIDAINQRDMVQINMHVGKFE